MLNYDEFIITDYIYKKCYLDKWNAIGLLPVLVDDVLVGVRLGEPVLVARWKPIKTNFLYKRAIKATLI